MQARATPSSRRRRGRPATDQAADALERHIGARIRACRKVRGLSQSALGDALGLTFQQIYKYENGKNRISVFYLHRIAETLDVPVSFFFDGLPDRSASADLKPPLTGRTLDVLLNLQALPGGVRRQVIDLIRVLSEVHGTTRSL